MKNTASSSFLLKVLTIALVGSILLSTSITSSAEEVAEPAKLEAGKSYYLQHNIWVEKGRSRATNYSQGDLVPFNTQVILRSIGSKKIELYADQQEITVVNVKQHTLRTAEQVANQLLSETPISLDGVSDDTLRLIQSGNLALGMTKEQAIITRGYPPRNRTASLESNKWVYLSNRFVQREIVFEDGKIISGREF